MTTFLLFICGLFDTKSKFIVPFLIIFITNELTKVLALLVPNYLHKETLVKKSYLLLVKTNFVIYAKKW